MEVYGTLSLFDNIFRIAKNADDKRLALQQKYVYVLHKKKNIDIQEVKDKLYNEALNYIQDENYTNITQLLQDYIEYYHQNI